MGVEDRLHEWCRFERFKQRRVSNASNPRLEGVIVTSSPLGDGAALVPSDHGLGTLGAWGGSRLQTVEAAASLGPLESEITAFMRP